MFLLDVNQLFFDIIKSSLTLHVNNCSLVSLVPWFMSEPWELGAL